LTRAKINTTRLEKIGYLATPIESYSRKILLSLNAYNTPVFRRYVSVITSRWLLYFKCN